MSTTQFPSFTKAKAPVLTRGREWPMENRIVPMEVLALGMCRTGTFSLMMALKQLGYNDVYHMKAVFERNDADFWVAAMQAKFEGKGAEYGRQEWDRLLGDCMSPRAVTDIPAAMFAAELIAAYPDAKVILTTRDVDRWYRSVLETIHAAHQGIERKIFALFQTKAGAMRDLRNQYFEHLWWNDFPRFGKRSFKEHNDLVRRLAPPERFLEYGVKQGWEPLCEFLGKEIPHGVEFPHLNDTESFRKSLGVGQMGVRNILQKVIKISLPAIVVGAAIWWRSSLMAYFGKY